MKRKSTTKRLLSGKIANRKVMLFPKTWSLYHNTSGNTIRSSIFFIESKESPLCPICNGSLSGYDSRLRHVIQADGSRESYRLKRLRCQGCGKLHVELPDCMQPYKHHSASIIEAELDETGIHCPADESTIRLWRRQFAVNLPQMEGALQSLWQQQSSRYRPLISSGSLLQFFRNTGPGWLTIVTQQLLGAGLGVPTQFAFCP